MKTYYLYSIPVLWIVFVWIYSLSIPKEGFAGAATVAIMLIVGLALLIGVITYHITKKVLWSILSVPIVFAMLIFLFNIFLRI